MEAQPPTPIGTPFPRPHRVATPFKTLASPLLKLLGVNLHQCLTMDSHVASVVSSCNFHISALHHIQPHLTLNVHKFVALSIVG